MAIDKQRYTLTKNERLHKRNLIKKLFSEGKSFTVYPYKVMWLETQFDSPYPGQFGISVPKRNFKKAVKRNRIKRLSREAFRLNKHLLYTGLFEKGRSIIFMLIYIGKDIQDFQPLEEKIILILRRLSKVDEKAAK